MTVREVNWDSSEGRSLDKMLQTLGFTEIETRELKGMIKTLRLRRLEAGETLIREGDSGDNSFLGYRGRLGVFKRLDSGSEARVATAGPGMIQGEIAVLSGLPRFATVRAEAAAEVFVFDAGEFRTLLDTSGRFRDGVDAMLVKRLSELPAA